MAQKTIQAKANVNFCMGLLEYPEIREFNKNKFDEMKERIPSMTSLPEGFITRLVNKDDILTFGESLVIGDHGIITVFPMSTYEKLSKETVELPSSVFGEIGQKATDENFHKYDKSTQKKLKAVLEAEQSNSRFVIKPKIELVA